MKLNNSSLIFWHATGTGFSFLFGIFLSSYLSRTFEIEEYGTFKQVLFVYNTLLVVFAVGLPKAVGFFLSNTSINQNWDIVKKITLLLLLLGLTFSLSVFSLSKSIALFFNNPKLEYNLKIFSLVPTFLLPSLGVDGIYSTLKKTKNYAFYQIFTKLILILIIYIILIKYGYNSISVMYGWLIASFLIFLISIYTIYLPFSDLENKDSKIKFKEIIYYSIPFMFSGILGIIYKSADKILISKFFGEKIFAVYINGFIEIPFVTILVGATSSVLLPNFIKLQKENNLQNMKELWLITWEKSALLIYPLLLIFLNFSKEIINILYGSNFEDSYLFFNIYIFSSFFEIVMFFPIIISFGGNKFYAYVHLLAAITMWVFSYLLIILNFEVYYVALVFLSTNILKTLLFLLYISNKLKTNFLDIVPYFQNIKIIIQCSLIIIMLNFIFSFFFIFINIWNIIIFVLIYYSFIILTSKYFKLDYIKVFKTLLNNNNR